MRRDAQHWYERYWVRLYFWREQMDIKAMLHLRFSGQWQWGVLWWMHLKRFLRDKEYAVTSWKGRFQKCLEKHVPYKKAYRINKKPKHVRVLKLTVKQIVFWHSLFKIWQSQLAGREVLTAVVTNVAIFWDTVPCSPYVNWCFGGIYHLWAINQQEAAG
jgi:hypothetical protein